MGTCDRTMGTCDCAEGFEGAACEYISCPGTPACSAHGECMSMSLLAENANLNGDATPYTYGATPNNPHAWDAEKMQGCRCDAGYFGYDCSQLACPYGDDPMTKYHANVPQANERQKITCNANDDDDTAGTLVFTFRQLPTAALAPTATYAELKAALEALDTVHAVSVYTEVTDDDYADDADDSLRAICSGVAFYVEFLAPTGDLPLLAVTTDGLTDAPTVEEDVAGTKEWLECSGRGKCDWMTGTCACFNGFEASDNQGGKGTIANCGYKGTFAELGRVAPNW
jgi:hypothetical protein